MPAPTYRDLGLTVSEYEVLSLICKGLTNKSVAQLLSRSTHTIAIHMVSLYKKTGTETRIALYTWAMANRLVPVPVVNPLITMIERVEKIVHEHSATESAAPLPIPECEPSQFYEPEEFSHEPQPE